NLQGARQSLIPIVDEIKQVHAYLAIEQARFPNRYQVEIHVADTVHDVLVPPFLIQVLVENALKHAFGSRKEENYVSVFIEDRGENTYICVQDNGMGIDKEKLVKLGKEVVYSEKGTGSALENVNKDRKSTRLNSSHVSISYAVF